MKAVIHIGLPKTGTSTIQRFLARNRQSLKKRGVFVPIGSGSSPGQHMELVAATWIPRNHVLPYFLEKYLRPGFTPEDQEKYWQKYRHQIERNCSENDTVIFSNERFARSSAEEVARVKNILNLFDDVTVVLYLRRHPEWLVSQYGQLVRGPCGLHQSFFDFLQEGMPELPGYYVCDYSEIVKRWSIFGKDKLNIRIFDKREFHANDLLSDFAHTVGFDRTGLERVEDANVLPLGSAGIEFMRLLNPHVSRKMRKRLLTNIQAFSEKSKNAYHLTRSEARHILDTYREGNDQIAREYLGREKLFSEDVSMYPEEVASPHGLTLEKCAEITSALWKQSEKEKESISYSFKTLLKRIKKRVSKIFRR